ncbi:putative transposase element L1Md-A101/L1Md-A102/L1Md-A2 [Labeo rohita]|uniref:Putative transposase element L1Md-A101/L1Md-A102/L1Md-A2 n=1 Tax=Labeo rohita TaxID=84645 RepID=A0A498M293_LABRO|nr:putative transposase element L1Md-A101/L1Md-A102/L1Md-A2 [Labeo rohita]
MMEFLEKMLREKLELQTSQSLQIEKAHRALAPRPPENAPPRSIVVNFLSYRMKEEILRTAWRKKDFVWQERRVNIDHDYAPDIIRKRKEYTEAKKLLTEKKIKFQTPFPAKLRVFFPDVTRVYNTAEEARKDLAVRGFPITVIQPPGTLME